MTGLPATFKSFSSSFLETGQKHIPYTMGPGSHTRNTKDRLLACPWYTMDNCNSGKMFLCYFIFWIAYQAQAPCLPHQCPSSSPRSGIYQGSVKSVCNSLSCLFQKGRGPWRMSWRQSRHTYKRFYDDFRLLLILKLSPWDLATSLRFQHLTANHVSYKYIC